MSWVTDDKKVCDSWKVDDEDNTIMVIIIVVVIAYLLSR